MSALFLISLILLAYPIVIYPVVVVCLAKLFGRKPVSSRCELPTVSLLIVVRNGETLIRDKIENSLGLEYPKERLDIIVASDGSTDQTAEIVSQMAARNSSIRFLDYKEHDGKISAINRAVPECRGNIIVFSDADALLDVQAISELVRWFSSEKVGGVCGRKYLAGSRSSIDGAQYDYVSYEDRIRQAESDLSSIASNEGKLYAIRRPLFTPIAEGVMDDIFVCMSVVKQGHRFIFAPGARARIPVPVKSRSHEILRRRRIVGPSLFGLATMRALFNPFRYGIYAFMLFSHKVMRRLVPLFLIAWIASACFLSFDHAAYAVIPAGIVASYAALVVLKATGAGKMPSLMRSRGVLEKLDYFLLGNVGTLLGIVDFALGRRLKKWEPIKD